MFMVLHYFQYLPESLTINKVAKMMLISASEAHMQTSALTQLSLATNYQGWDALMQCAFNKTKRSQCHVNAACSKGTLLNTQCTTTWKCIVLYVWVVLDLVIWFELFFTDSTYIVLAFKTFILTKVTMSGMITFAL